MYSIDRRVKLLIRWVRVIFHIPKAHARVQKRSKIIQTSERLAPNPRRRTTAGSSLLWNHCHHEKTIPCLPASLCGSSILASRSSHHRPRRPPLRSCITSAQSTRQTDPCHGARSQPQCQCWHILLCPYPYVRTRSESRRHEEGFTTVIGCWCGMAGKKGRAGRWIEVAFRQVDRIKQWIVERRKERRDVGVW